MQGAQKLKRVATHHRSADSFTLKHLDQDLTNCILDSSGVPNGSSSIHGLVCIQRLEMYARTDQKTELQTFCVGQQACAWTGDEREAPGLPRRAMPSSTLMALMMSAK